MKIVFFCIENKYCFLVPIICFLLLDFYFRGFQTALIQKSGQEFLRMNLNLHMDPCILWCKLELIKALFPKHSSGQNSYLCTYIRLYMKTPIDFAGKPQWRNHFVVQIGGWHRLKSQTLCTEGVTQIVNSNMLFWAGKIWDPDSYGLSIQFRATTYPFLALLVCQSENTVKIANIIQGS